MPYAHRVEKGKKIRLADFDSGERSGLTRQKGEKRSAELGAEMAELHDLIFEAGRNSLLIVLQGRDTSGKDGATYHLLRFMNAQNCRVIPFKVPTAEELAHDFLWRAHLQTPGRGQSAIFNRSHYEDVLVVRVHGLVPEAEWRARYDRINQFESLLASADTIVLKFYLHISKEEQKERLLDREKDVDKSWKLSLDDWKEREFWDQYTAAYEALLTRCSPSNAPWWIVPADHKWYRNLALTETIVEALRPYRMGWTEHLKETGDRMKLELEAYRRAHNEEPRKDKTG